MTRKRPAPAAEEPVDVRILPHDLASEKAVLGAILIDNTRYPVVAELLRPEHFFRRAHAILFAAMGRLAEKRSSIDGLTLRDELQRTDEMDEVGGPAYILSLTDGVPRGMKLPHIAAIIQGRAYLRAVIRLGNDLIDHGYDSASDPAEVVREADRRLLDLQRGNYSSTMTDLSEGAQALYADLEYRIAHKGTLHGLATGFPQIDDLTMGLQQGDMVVIAARPSMGKTLMTMNIGITAALAGKRVGIFSLEMRRRQLEYRILASLAEVDAARIRSGFIGDLDYERLGPAWGKLHELHIAINDRSRQTVFDIRNACRRMKHEGGLDLIIVDYVQLVPGTIDKRGANRNEEMTDISHRLKDLADEMQVPNIVVSQLNRSSAKYERRPQLSDLRESGCLTGDTMVYGPVSGAWTRLDAIRQGDCVASLCGSKIVPVDVEASFATGSKPVSLLTTGSGRTIRATANHRFLTPQGWIRLDNLSSTDLIATPRCAYSGDIYWDSVRSILPDGTAPVFDLTILPTKNFIANGIIVHNSLEQDADVVGFLHRKSHRESGLTEFILEKQRNGPTGTVMLMVNRSTQRFHEATADELAPPEKAETEAKEPETPRHWRRGARH